MYRKDHWRLTRIRFSWSKYIPTFELCVFVYSIFSTLAPSICTLILQDKKVGKNKISFKKRKYPKSQTNMVIIWRTGFYLFLGIAGQLAQQNEKEHPKQQQKRFRFDIMLISRKEPDIFQSKREWSEHFANSWVKSWITWTISSFDSSWACSNTSFCPSGSQTKQIYFCCKEN